MVDSWCMICMLRGYIIYFIFNVGFIIIVFLISLGFWVEVFNYYFYLIKFEFLEYKENIFYES